MIKISHDQQDMSRQVWAYVKEDWAGFRVKKDGTKN